MIKKIKNKLITATCLLSTLMTIPSFADEAEMKVVSETTAETTEEDAAPEMIVVKGEDATADLNGYMLVDLYVEDAQPLPLSVDFKNEDGNLTSFVIESQGQQLKIKPGKYTLTKAVNGEGKILPTGATLNIDQTQDSLYFTFANAPENKDRKNFIEFITSNAVAIVICIIFVALVRKFSGYF